MHITSKYRTIHEERVRSRFRCTLFADAATVPSVPPVASAQNRLSQDPSGLEASARQLGCPQTLRGSRPPVWHEASFAVLGLALALALPLVEEGEVGLLAAEAVEQKAEASVHLRFDCEVSGSPGQAPPLDDDVGTCTDTHNPGLATRD